jgi:hypothetical protein
MNKIRPLRTLGAALAAVGALVVSGYAGQDLWHYWQAISAGYSEWIRSSQGLWMLTCGVSEAALAVAFIVSAAKCLGATGKVQAAHAERA